MLGIRNNERNQLEQRNEVLKSAYKDPFDMLFETVMEKEKKANLQYTAPKQNLQDFEQTPSMDDVKVTKLEVIKEEF
jgi:hypothetical protein